MLSSFTATANAIAETTKKRETERILGEYLRSLDDAALERAAVFFPGSGFSRRDERVAGIGGAGIGEAVQEPNGLNFRARSVTTAPVILSEAVGWV